MTAQQVEQNLDGQHEDAGRSSWGRNLSSEEGLVGHQKEELGGCTGAQDQAPPGPTMLCLVPESHR